MGDEMGISEELASEWFRALANFDVEKVQELLRDCPALVKKARAATGSTGLHLAVLADKEVGTCIAPSSPPTPLDRGSLLFSLRVPYNHRQ